MNLSKTQIIIFSAVGLVVLFLILGVLGVIPGIKKEKNVGTSSFSPMGQSKPLKELSFWIFGEEEKDFSNFIRNFEQANNVKIKLKAFADYNSFLKLFLQTMAEGNGPDIFMIPSTEIPVFLNKIYPLPLSNISLTTFNNTFPQVVIKDVIFKDNIYGLPLSIDTLALIYNRDLFSKAGVIFPPADWNSFVGVLEKLTVKDEEGKILQAGAALGSSNVKNAPDILYSILLQTGAKINEGDKIVLNDEQSRRAFIFFRQFADTKNKYFTWDSGGSDSFDMFAKNKVAMIFGFQSDLKVLRSKNSFLNLEIAPFPQLSTSTFFAVSPRYKLFTVSKQTKEPLLAWKLVYALTLDPVNAENYVKASKKPPALLELINKYTNDPNLSVFVKQALYAKSWYGPNRDALDNVINQTIDTFLNMSDTKNVYSLLSQAQSKMTTIINNVY